jgi:UMP-CMP kinase
MEKNYAALRKLSKPRPKVIFVMGGPGAGKGTQCAKLLKKYPELDSYSTGDLLRQKLKEDSEESRKLAADMKKGVLVTSGTVVELMEEYMNTSSKNVFLADGFPRN